MELLKQLLIPEQTVKTEYQMVTEPLILEVGQKFQQEFPSSHKGKSYSTAKICADLESVLKYSKKIGSYIDVIKRSRRMYGNQFFTTNFTDSRLTNEPFA